MRSAVRQPGKPTTRVAVGVALAFALLATGAGCATSADDRAEATLDTATKYHEGLAGHRGFASVPMSDHLSFTGPGRTASNAEQFRQALRGLSTQVLGFEMRHQLVDSGLVLTFYSLDLGTPGGPIAMAERLRIVRGETVEVELLFDSRKLPAAPAAAPP